MRYGFGRQWLPEGMGIVIKRAQSLAEHGDLKAKRVHSEFTSDLKPIPSLDPIGRDAPSRMTLATH